MKVMPKNDDMRKLLKHPTGGGFIADGPAEWPDDSFTHRRIRDGDVTVVEEKQAAQQPQPAAEDPAATEGAPAKKR